MSVLLSLLVVATAPDAPAGGRYPGAAEVFHCTFDDSWDRDYDGWPDRWTRRQGPGFPHYVRIFLSPEPVPAGDRSLRIELDGGGAVAYSPPIQVKPPHDYVVEALLKTEGLRHDRAYLSLTFLDRDQQPLETFSSEKVRDCPDWRKVRLGPVSPSSPQTRLAMIGLHLEPGSQADLRGAAAFGDLWLGRLPRISLSVGKQSHVFTDPREATISCDVSGFTRPNATVRFELFDVFGARLAEAEQSLLIRAASALSGLDPDSPEGEPTTLAGGAQWQPPLAGPGFYRVQAGIAAEGQTVHRRNVTLVVIQPQRPPTGSEFGWSFSGHHDLQRFPWLGQAMSQVGIQWAKCPVWYDEQAGEEPVRKLADFIERLSYQGIEPVAVLDPRPDDRVGGSGESSERSVAELFSQDRKVWGPPLEAIVLRLGAQVRWWQLGSDRDASFTGYPRLSEKIREIQAVLERAGNTGGLGIAWSWLHPLPETTAGDPASLRFLVLSADPPLTARELTTCLAATRRGNLDRPARSRADEAPAGPEASATSAIVSAARQEPRPPEMTQRYPASWVLLEPLPRDEYSWSDRAADLVGRMIAAKREGAAAIFLADPLGPRSGLIHEDGTPSELFLPWRTTALLLGGAEPMGTIALPQGSANWVFARGDDAVMAVWNAKPVRETYYLGEDVRRVDLWGRETAIPKAGSGQVIEAGPLPAFYSGINRRIARWQLDFALGEDRIPSVLDRRHRNQIVGKNSFSQAVEGTVALVAPEGWSIHPQKTSFRLAGGEAFRQPVEIALPADAGNGAYVIRADFEVQADRPYRFSIYRSVRLGSDDVRMEIETQWNSRGELEVQQYLLNDTDREVRFRCQLLTSDRPRMTTLMVGLGRSQTVYVFRLPNARQLVGKTLWLQAQEVDGPRVLNYRFVARE